MIGIRPSKKREAYIFPDVIVAPASDDVRVNPSDDVENDMKAQKGLTIASPVPSDTNKSNSIAGIRGEASPRLVISPSLPIVLTMSDATVLRRGRVTTPAFESQLLGNTSRPLVEITVPRYVVESERYPDVQQEFLRDFFRWPTFSATYVGLGGNGYGWSLPGCTTSTSPAAQWTGFGTASFILSENDDDILVFVVRKLTTLGANDQNVPLNGFSLHCLRYEVKNGKPDEDDLAPGTGGVAKPFLMEAQSADYASGFNLSGSLSNPDCVAVRLRGDVFIVTTDRRSSSTVPVQFMVHKYEPDSVNKFDGTIEPFTNKEFISNILAKINTGISGDAGDTNAIFALGANVDTILSDKLIPGRQTVLLAKTKDFTNFSDKYVDRLDLTALDSFQQVSIDAIGTTDVKFTRATVSGPTERTRHGWAVTRFGEIYKSEDEGVTWRRQSTFKSVSDVSNAGNLDFRVPIRSITIANDNTVGSEILYATADNGTILRTVDGGDTWVVVITSDNTLIKDGLERFNPPVEIPTGRYAGTRGGSITAAYEGTDELNTGATERKTIWIGDRQLVRMDFTGTTATATIDTVQDVYIETDTIHVRHHGGVATVVGSVVADDRNKLRIVVGGPNGLKWIKVDGTNHVILAVGSPNKNGSTILAIKDEGPATNKQIYEASNYPIAPTQGKINGITKLNSDADSPIYICGDNGFVADVDLTSYDNSAIGPIVTSRSFPSKVDLIDIAASYNEDTTKTSLFVLTEDLLFRSTPETGSGIGQTWIVQQFGEIFEGVAATNDSAGNSITTSSKATSIFAMDFDTLIVGAGIGILISNIDAESRVNPDIMYLGSNQWLLACSNVSQGQVEFFHSTDNGASFKKQEKIGSVIKFEVPDDPHDLSEDDLNKIPKPTLVRQVNEDIWCLIGGGRIGPACGCVSHNNGRTWEQGDDSSVSIPMGIFKIDKPLPDGGGAGIDTAEGFVSQSFIRGLTAIATGDGRVFAAAPALALDGGIYTQNQQDSQVTFLGMQGGKHGIWVCRDLENDQRFSESDDLREGLPVVPNKGMHIGLGGARVVFSAPPRVGDSWTINKDWLFPARHIIVESPSRFYATEDDESGVYDADDVQIILNRTLSAHDPISGRGTHWNISAMALFGTNFREAEIWIAHPDFKALAPFGDIIPAADRIDFPLKADVDIGQATLVEGTRIIDEGKHWIPNQFAPITRNYYVMALDDDERYVYKILSNTRNMLICDHGDITLTTRLKGFDSGANGTGKLDYLIFGDRMYSLGDDGLWQDLPFPSLIDTPYEYTRFVVINIPAQRTFEGYRKLGTAQFGRHLPVEFVVPNTGQIEKRRMRGRASRWEYEVNVTETNSISGVDTIEHHSRPIQKWSLPYEQVATWDRDLSTHAIGPKLRRAFSVIFDTDDKESIELVRMTKGNSWTGSGVGRYSQILELKEVV